jgi:hypothetical protein
MDSYGTAGLYGWHLMLLLAIGFIPAVIGYVWLALSLNALFKKVGEPTWAGWVPFYNLAVLLKLGGLSPWLILIAIAFPIPFFGWLAWIAIEVLVLIAAYRINIAFGHRDGGAVGMTILAVLLPVWASVLGWGSARFVGPDPRMRAAAMGQNPGASFAPAYSQPGFPAEPGQPGFGAGYTPAPGAFAAPGEPAAPAGYVPPAPPVGYVPPAAPAGYVPPAPATSFAPPPAAPADAAPPAAAVEPVSFAPQPAPATPAQPFAPRYSNPTASASDDDDDDLEGIDDPVQIRRTPAEPAPDETPDQDAAASVPTPSPNAADASSGASGRVGPPVIDAVPAPAPAADPVDPWAPPALATPRRSPMPEEGASFSDTSAEVSAVEGSPLAGAPMSARSSVSAQRQEPELPDNEDAFDETIIAPRRRTEWMLTPPLGVPIRVTAPVLILGRRPAADPAYPQAQLVDLADDTRTVSKTHARLELAADHWTITDLDSTNGVVLIAADGTETELPSGGSQLVGERFLLGDAHLQLTRGKD